MKQMLSSIALLLAGCFPTSSRPMNPTDNAHRFAANYSSFKMNIEAVGIARIPAAHWAHDTLVVDYAYFSEGEQRQGRMSLAWQPPANRFEGTWRTQADNGNVYQGPLYLVFQENGEATGQYTFLGSRYAITLFLAAP
ncbi:hypothetical protein SAMN00120144_0221 [Hymenobacter roseosalivarius DSM 11622]|uniref:Lipoprotein n=1 Tax=Hymenobacter roseosalivarius DSM 11622 TaxID=645990 RepID=A0A1W1W1J7_9BACT|nr:hypothetical protein [Hymenobacter roseosalivarius]SMB99485.1 hypothetical protein SAMN00120144_0221 [Hymenobacter roseosalivarius DSM 11622]